MSDSSQPHSAVPPDVAQKYDEELVNPPPTPEAVKIDNAELKAGAGVFQALPDAMMRIHRKLKAQFDPAGVFNPGRMYVGL